MTRVPLVQRPWALFAVFALVFGVTLADVSTQTPPSTPSTKPTQAPAAAAATPAAPVFMRLNIIEVRPDMVNEFVALQKSETIPALQKAGVQYRHAWRSGGFGSTFTVAFVSPITSFAMMDEPNPLLKSMGEEAYKAYLAKMGKLIASSRVYAIRDRPELGLKTEGSPMAKLAILASIEVVPGRATEWETIIKNEWTPALKKAGVANYAISQVVLGGSIAQYHTLTPIENYAQLDKGHPIQQSIGEAGMNKILAKMTNSTRSAERFVIRYDEDLSFRTKQTSEVR